MGEGGKDREPVQSALFSKLPLQVICRGERRSDLCLKELFGCSAEKETGMGRAIEVTSRPAR